MSSGCNDISGRWDGTFYYPDVPEAGPVTPFLANLTESGGVLNGTIIEPNEYSPATAHSTIAGQRIGSSVTFSKTYHGAGDEYSETVVYSGSLSDDANMITGEWSIDHWCGTFEMVRELSSDPAECAETAEGVSTSV
ncbi:hypothetical protein [Erythrobacter sp. Alg231-14]|uniref:hypothetical protein n=1 Tax=Erythrobacter sp. Alg231-14 TaxID=1922225 RepID=UPI000D54D152